MSNGEFVVGDIKNLKGDIGDIIRESNEFIGTILYDLRRLNEPQGNKVLEDILVTMEKLDLLRLSVDKPNVKVYQSKKYKEVVEESENDKPIYIGKREIVYHDYETNERPSLRDIIRRGLELVKGDTDELVDKFWNNVEDIVHLGGCYNPNVRYNFSNLDIDLKEINNLYSASNGVLGDNKIRGAYRNKTEVILAAHHSVADLSVLSDFEDIKSSFDLIMGTYTTLSRSWTYDSTTSVTLRDTKLLAPAGNNSLRALGNMYDFPKLDVGEYIFDMRDLVRDDKTKFEAYALRDADITLHHLLSIEDSCHTIVGRASIPVTLAGLAREYLIENWKGMDYMDQMQRFGNYNLSDIPKLFTPKGLASTQGKGR